MSDRISRREHLATVATASSALLAGCNVSFNPDKTGKFRLQATEFNQPPTKRFLQTSPGEVSANFHLDYSKSYKRKLYSELVKNKSLTCIEWPLTYPYTFGGRTLEKPHFIKTDTAYYRVHLENLEEMSKEYLELYLVPIDGTPPSTATTKKSPVTDLSERDQEILMTALRWSQRASSSPGGTSGD